MTSVPRTFYRSMRLINQRENKSCSNRCNTCLLKMIFALRSIFQISSIKSNCKLTKTEENRPNYEVSTIGSYCNGAITIMLFFGMLACTQLLNKACRKNYKQCLEMCKEMCMCINGLSCMIYQLTSKPLIKYMNSWHSLLEHDEINLVNAKLRRKLKLLNTCFTVLAIVLPSIYCIMMWFMDLTQAYMLYSMTRIPLLFSVVHILQLEAYRMDMTCTFILGVYRSCNGRITNWLQLKCPVFVCHLKSRETNFLENQLIVLTKINKLITHQVNGLKVLLISAMARNMMLVLVVLVINIYLLVLERGKSDSLFIVIYLQTTLTITYLFYILYRFQKVSEAVSRFKYFILMC